MFEKRPLVSIGLPVYNGENFLSEAIAAILAQSFEDYEVIISDNASDDRTAEICKAYAERESRIRYFRSGRNQGAAWNYNRVFALARGKYFKWAAHDDLVAPVFLERCVKVLERDPEVALCYAKSAVIDENGNLLRYISDDFERMQDEPHRRLQAFAPELCHPVFGLIRHSALARTDLIGRYPGSDVTLLWQLLLAGKVSEVPEVLFFRRTHPGTSVRANPDSKSRMKWFDPQRRSWWYLPTWHFVWKFAGSISATDLDLMKKVRCYRELAKRYLLHPGWMIKDFSYAVREALGESPWKKRKDLI